MDNLFVIIDKDTNQIRKDYHNDNMLLFENKQSAKNYLSLVKDKEGRETSKIIEVDVQFKRR